VEAGSAFDVTLTVETERDTVASSYMGTVSLGLSSPGAASLGGPLTVSLDDGVATFSGVTVSAGGEYTLTATSAGVASATSSPLKVSASPTIAPAIVPPTIMAAEPLIIGTRGHRRLAGFELEFSQPLDPFTAYDVDNYFLAQTEKVRRRTVEKPVRVRVIYTPELNSVDLIMAGGATFPHGGELEVIGTSPGGIASAKEIPLDGSGDGYPGTDGLFLVLPKGRGIIR
jgi:hypothetical protein